MNCWHSPEEVKIHVKNKNGYIIIATKNVTVGIEYREKF